MCFIIVTILLINCSVLRLIRYRWKRRYVFRGGSENAIQVYLIEFTNHFSHLQFCRRKNKRPPRNVYSRIVNIKSMRLLFVSWKWERPWVIIYWSPSYLISSHFLLKYVLWFLLLYFYLLPSLINSFVFFCSLPIWRNVSSLWLIVIIWNVIRIIRINIIMWLKVCWGGNDGRVRWVDERWRRRRERNDCHKYFLKFCSFFLSFQFLVGFSI